MAKKKLHPSVWIHYGAGVAISIVFFLIPYLLKDESINLNWGWATVASLLGGIFFGTWKEHRDKKLEGIVPGKRWDNTDWWFTVSGSLTIPLIVGLTLIF